MLDAATGKSIRRFVKRHGEWGFVDSLSPNGQYVLSGRRGGALVVWDVRSGLNVKEISMFSDGITAAVFHPDGRRVILATIRNAIEVWDIETGFRETRMTGHSLEVNQLRVLADGKILVSAGVDNKGGTELGRSEIKYWKLD